MKWYNPYLRYLYENGCILGGSFSEPTEFLPERPHHWCPGGNYFSSAFCISATQTLFSSKDLFILRKRRERTCISRKRGKRRGRYRGRESFKQVPCWVSSLIWGLILQPMTSGSRVRCLKDWVPQAPQCFSDFNVHGNLLGIFKKFGFWFSRSGRGLTLHF